MPTETRQPVICPSCGWIGKRMTGKIHVCPKCSAFLVRSASTTGASKPRHPKELFL